MIQNGRITRLADAHLPTLGPLARDKYIAIDLAIHNDHIENLKGCSCFQTNAH